MDVFAQLDIRYIVLEIVSVEVDCMWRWFISVLQWNLDMLQVSRTRFLIMAHFLTKVNPFSICWLQPCVLVLQKDYIPPTLDGFLPVVFSALRAPTKLGVAKAFAGRFRKFIFTFKSKCALQYKSKVSIVSKHVTIYKPWNFEFEHYTFVL